MSSGELKMARVIRLLLSDAAESDAYPPDDLEGAIPGTSPAPWARGPPKVVCPFMPANPAAWFGNLETMMGYNNITRDYHRYACVIANVDARVTTEIQNIIESPPTENMYETIKIALLSAYGRTQDDKTRELLGLSGLGDRLPTAMLRHFRALDASTSCGCNMVRRHFLNQLTPDVQSALSLHASVPLDELAEMADLLVQSKASDKQRIAAIARAKQKLKDKRENKLTKLVDGVCGYHRKWKSDALRCVDGCKDASKVAAAVARRAAARSPPAEN